MRNQTRPTWDTTEPFSEIADLYGQAEHISMGLSMGMDEFDLTLKVVDITNDTKKSARHAISSPNLPPISHQSPPNLPQSPPNL